MERFRENRVAFSGKTGIIKNRKEVRRMNCDQMLNVVTEMGRILLQNGAEIHRVEESMQRICLAWRTAGSLPSPPAFM